jgi:hypothetical protein
VCLTCGCDRPAWAHGSKSNVTQKKLKAAAMSKAGPKNVKKAASNLTKTERKVQSGKLSPKMGAPKNS